MRSRVGGSPVVFEAETRLIDVQELIRRLDQKQRDANLAILVLVVADTRHNREVVALHGTALRTEFPMGPRAVLRALFRGKAPGSNGLVTL